MPIDPRVAALRAGMGGPQVGQPVNPYMQGLQQPVQPNPPQSGLGMQGGGVNTGGMGNVLSAASANMVEGMPQANERFAQGQRMGDQADMLREKSLDGEPEGRMIGRIYVPGSIFQYGAKGIQAYVAMQKEKEQKSERSGAAEQQSGYLSKWLRSLTDEQAAAATSGAGQS